MINSAARFYFGVAFVAIVAAVAYNGVVSDRAGALLFFFVFLAAALTGLATVGSWVPDRARWIGPDAPPPEEVVLGPSVAPKPSNWPIVAGAALGVLGLGLSLGADMLIVGMVAAVIAAGGWLGQAFREDRTFTRREGARIWERVVGPIGVPLGALALIGFIVICISRVLLAVNEHAAVVVAIVVAIVVLSAFAFLASRPRATSTVMGMLGGLAVVALASAGIAGASTGERQFEPATPEPVNVVSLTAKGIQFSKSQIQVEAGHPITISFHNDDAGTYHNVAVYTPSTPPKPLDAGAPIRGVESTKYVFGSLQAGRYAFRCDFHSNMVGTLVVQ
jgi:plastocyanin